MDLKFAFGMIVLISSAIGASIYRPMYYPEVGVLMEPNSIVISYDNIKYVSVLYHFGNPKINTNRICTQTQEVINKTLTSFYSQFSYFKSLIPENSRSFMNEFCASHLGLCQEVVNNSTRRHKRSAEFLASISGLIGLGNSAYTWYTGNKLEEHLDIVRSKMLDVIKEENRITDKLNEAVAIENDIIKKSSKSFTTLKRLIEKDSCTLEENIISNMLNILLLEINRDFSALMNMINGQPDPNIISSNVIDMIIDENPDLKNTIYVNDRGLLLTLSKSNLIYTNDEKDTLVFLLEIPLIKNHMYSPLFSVYNGGWEKEGIYFKLNLPLNFYLYSSIDSLEYHAVSSIHDSCYYRSHMYVCDNSKHFLKQEMICMNALLKNKSYDQCEILVTKKSPGVQISKTKSGVFATGSPTVTKIDSIGESYHMITDRSLSANWTQFYPYSTFNKLIIESIIIVSNHDPIPIIYSNHTYNLDLDFDLEDAHSFLITNPWTPMKTIKALVKSDSLYTMSRLYSSSTSYSIYIALLILILILILTIVLWLMWKNFRETKSKLDRNQIVLSSLLTNRR